MIYDLDVHPVYSGVVYSPGWEGWQFFPDDHLSVGLLTTNSGEAYVRSVLLFSLPEQPRDTILLQAFVRVHIILNEPLEMEKHICLIEAPGDPRVGWSLEDEMHMPYLAEQQLSSEIGLDLDFNITNLIERWLTGSPNHGIVLHPGRFDHGLVAFPRVEAVGPTPVLKLSYAVPSAKGEAGKLTVTKDQSATSWELPNGPISVRNLGPGLAWISPLYDLDGSGEPIDPAGIPEGILEPGEYMIIKPRLRARRTFIRVDTALSETVVVIIPVSSDVI